jgi:hypothetical protein
MDLVHWPFLPYLISPFQESRLLNRLANGGEIILKGHGTVSVRRS